MSPGVLLPHVVIPILWTGFAGLCVGVGTVVHRALLGPRAAPRPPSLLVALWLGLAGLILLLQGWHLWAPIDGRPLALTLGLAAWGWALRLRRPTPMGSRGPSGRDPWARVAAGLLLAGGSLWLADRSLAPLRAYDTGVYMIPGVEWARAYPAVPGLAALHGRLGFNSSNVLLASLVEAGPWPAAAPHLLGGFFAFVLLLRIATRLGSVSHEPGTHGRAVFDLALLPAVVAVGLDNQLVPSLSADVSAAAAQLAAASLLLVAADPDERADARLDHGLGAAAALLTAITFKVTVLAFAGVGALLLAGPLRTALRETAPTGRPPSGLVLLAGLLIGTWLIHGVVASGYPLYPSTLGALPVGWRVPTEQALAEGAWVRHFARTWYSTDVANAGDVAGYAWLRLRWMGPWLTAVATGRDGGLVSVGLGGAACFGVLAALRGRAIGRGLWRAGLLSAVGLAFWFCTAPRPSFGIAPAWLACATALLAFVRTTAPARVPRVAGAAVLALLLLVVTAAVATEFPGQVRHLRAWRWTVLAAPDADRWFREMEAGSTPYRTVSGLMVNRSTTRSLCVREPLPCTPHPAPNLEARRPGDLKGGFRITGPWQPEQWPNRGAFLEGWRRARGTGEPGRR